MSAQRHLRRAEAALDLDRYDEAAAEAGLAVAADVENGHAYYLLARALHGLKRNTEALKTLEIALQKEPEEPLYHASRSDILRALLEYPRAMEAAEECLRLDPNGAMGHVAIGLCARDLGEHARAVKALEEAVAISPTAYIQRLLADAYLAKKDYKRAEATYRASLQLAPNDAVTLNNLGCALLGRNEKQAAALAFKAALLLDPTLQEAKQNTHSTVAGMIGRVAPIGVGAGLVAALKIGGLGAGKYFAYFGVVMARHLTDPATWVGAALLVLVIVGFVIGRRRWLRRESARTRSSSSCTRSSMSCGSSRSAHRAVQEARGRQRRGPVLGAHAVTEHPSLSRARAALELRRFEDAAREAALAIAADPEHAEAFNVLARAQAFLERPIDALKTIGIAIAKRPEEPRFYATRSLILRKLGNSYGALAAADEALRLDPDRLEGYLERARCLLDIDKERAIEAAKRAVELFPDEASSHGLLAYAYFAHDYILFAEAHYRRALAIDPNDASSLNNLGCALRAQGKRVDAAIAFKAAVLLDPTMRQAKHNVFQTIVVMRSWRMLFGVGAFIAFMLFCSLFLLLVAVAQAFPVDRALWRFMPQLVLALSVLVGFAFPFVVREVNARALRKADPELLALFERIQNDPSGRA